MSDALQKRAHEKRAPDNCASVGVADEAGSSRRV